MKTILIDALEQPGGQVAVLYPEKYIFDAPGYRKVLAKDLVKNLVDQAFQFNPTTAFGERVVSLKKNREQFELATEKGRRISRRRF